MKANAHQKQLIHINQPNKELKEMMVQQITGDISKVSCNDLTFDQANMIIKKLGKQPVKATKEDDPVFWAYFDRKNKQHMQIQSLLHQLKWTMPNTKWGRVPDLERFGSWLQSERAPVSKPLKKMTAAEVSKTIEALNGILKSMYK